MKGDADDPKALIREAYAIAGISLEECRSIYLDWALSLPETADTRALSEKLGARYGAMAPDHPMTGVLREGAARMTRPARRGGWQGRRSES